MSLLAQLGTRMPLELEKAIAQLDAAHDSLLGLGTLSESLLSLTQIGKEEVHENCPRTSTPWGVRATQGTRPNMEDAYSVQLTPPVVTQAPSVAEHACDKSPGMQDSIQVPLLPEDLAVLSVFDGHGGTEVAEHCREKLHKHFAYQLSLQRNTFDTPCQGRIGFHDKPDNQGDSDQAVPQHSLDHVGEALRAAFGDTDRELEGSEAGDYVGATAVVAVVGKTHIWVAHCGDSRAVIQRDGEAIALTNDHKPDREDESARIKAAGGRVVYNSGSHRVMGMLAMTRAIGDHFLRPYVIAEPEVSCFERTPHDEVLVLATDGLWDVFSCKEATTLAMRCINRSKERGMSRHGACRVAASVLTKVALERGSRDNITVIVVDVTMNQHTHSPATMPAPHGPSNVGGAQAQPPRRVGSEAGCGDKAGHSSQPDEKAAPVEAEGAGDGSAQAAPPISVMPSREPSSGGAAPKPCPNTADVSQATPAGGSSVIGSRSSCQVSLGGVPGAKGVSLGQRTQSFSVGTCLWLKSQSRDMMTVGEGQEAGAPASQSAGCSVAGAGAGDGSQNRRSIERQCSAPQRSVQSAPDMAPPCATTVTQSLLGPNTSNGVSPLPSGSLSAVPGGSRRTTADLDHVAPQCRQGAGGVVTAQHHPAFAIQGNNQPNSPSPSVQAAVSPIMRALRQEHGRGGSSTGSEACSGPAGTRSSDNGVVGPGDFGGHQEVGTQRHSTGGGLSAGVGSQQGWAAPGRRSRRVSVRARLSCSEGPSVDGRCGSAGPGSAEAIERPEVEVSQAFEAATMTV